MIKTLDSPALLVRSVPYGESDLIATFFTRDFGILTATVRGARRSQKRFGGALEPIHLLTITLDDKGRELCLLKEARILKPRMGITASLEAMESAGEALRWTRHLCPQRTPEPAAWRSLEELFELLDAGKEPRGPLAIFGLRMLANMGYALELERCIGCGRPCPEGRAAFFDAVRGGLICTSCRGAPRTRGDATGGRRTLDATIRGLALRAQQGELDALAREHANEIIEIVEETMAAHTGSESL